MDRLKLNDIPELDEAIKALGSNDIERAQALGVDDRTLRLWRSEGVPLPIVRVLQRPLLAHAIARAAVRMTATPSTS